MAAWLAKRAGRGSTLQGQAEAPISMRWAYPPDILEHDGVQAHHSQICPMIERFSTRVSKT